MLGMLDVAFLVSLLDESKLSAVFLGFDDLVILPNTTVRQCKFYFTKNFVI